MKKIILTKDNLLKRGWTENSHCHFCGADETVIYMLFVCTVAKFLWQTVICSFGMVMSLESLSDIMGIQIDPSQHHKGKMSSVDVQQCAGLSVKQYLCSILFI
jgi:hypothetical protein